MTDATAAPRVVAKWEWAGIAALVGAMVAALKISWFKWPDPLIDFGRELYLPWRINEGAVLYRDIDANYGPLSHYFNALVFRVLGTGLSHLVAVNLAIYGAILALVYCEVRAGWGRLAAFAASLVFIVAFSFSQLIGVGNYNFAAPYAHETTHGFLLVLALIATLASWLRRPRWWKAAAAGGICGLCALLKVEILFTAAVVTLGALVRAVVTMPERRHVAAWLRDAGAFVVAGVVPPLVATAILWRTGAYSPAQAFLWANVGWLGLFIYKNIAGDPIQASFMGIAGAARNAWNIALYGGLSVAGVCAAGAVCKYWIRTSTAGFFVACGLVVAAAAVSSQLSWLEAGTVFPMWLALALTLAIPPAPRVSLSANLRWLLLLAAGAFLVRMALNPRIYHYGYCQAALAGVVTTATIFRTLPDRLALGGFPRMAYLAAVGAFLAVGLWTLEKKSSHIFSFKTQPVGKGADRFYGFTSDMQPSAYLVEQARRALMEKRDCRSLLVLPEGVMLNYLLRKPSPTHVYMFNPYWLNWRESVREDLQHAPPDYVVLISRDLHEYGVDRFGESPEHGATLMSWVESNCSPVWHVGGDPLDAGKGGVSVLKCNAKPSAD